MTPERALVDYALCLQMIKAIDDEYLNKYNQLIEKRNNIENWLINSAKSWEEHLTIPELVYEQRPYVAWKLSPLKIGSTIEAHMAIDDRVIPALEARYKPEITELKKYLEEIEGTMLRVLQESGLQNASNDAGEGMAYIAKIDRYTINDKHLFAKYAVDNGFASELTITIRPNSKFMGSLVETNGELPAGVSMNSVLECRFKK